MSFEGNDYVHVFNDCDKEQIQVKLEQFTRNHWKDAAGAGYITREEPPEIIEQGDIDFFFNNGANFYEVRVAPGYYIPPRDYE
jgi:hypothetical protein